MARIRTIKPEFFTSEDIVSRTAMARILYIALWCEADKEGRLVWKPATFKLRYLPGDACDINALCTELVEAGLVVLYGDGFAYIPTFKAHQHINPRESASQLPEPDAKTTRPPRVGTRQPRDSDAQGGREGKGREGIQPVASTGEGRFHEFWTAWPNTERKEDRKKCLAKWRASHLDDQADTIVAHVQALKPTRKWTEGFEPAPLTYLNGERWRDGVVVQAQDVFAGAI